MDTLYQSLVAVEPLTLMAQIVNLFLQMYVFRRFFLDKVLAVMDERRVLADKELSDAETARSEAIQLKAAYEKNLQQAQTEAATLLTAARNDADHRSEQILAQARKDARRLQEKADADLALQRKKALLGARDDISSLSLAIAEKVVGRQMNEDDQLALIDQFLAELGEAG